MTTKITRQRLFATLMTLSMVLSMAGGPLMVGVTSAEGSTTQAPDNTQEGVIIGGNGVTDTAVKHPSQYNDETPTNSDTYATNQIPPIGSNYNDISTGGINNFSNLRSTAGNALIQPTEGAIGVGIGFTNIPDNKNYILGVDYGTLPDNATVEITPVKSDGTAVNNTYELEGSNASNIPLSNEESQFIRESGSITFVVTICGTTQNIDISEITLAATSREPDAIFAEQDLEENYNTAESYLDRGQLVCSGMTAPTNVNITIQDEDDDGVYEVGEELTFTGDATNPNDGDLTYQWSNAVNKTGETVTKTFNETQHNTAELTVTNAVSSRTATQSFNVVCTEDFSTEEQCPEAHNEPPTAKIEYGISDGDGDSTIEDGEEVLFTGYKSTDPEGGPLEYQWEIDGTEVSEEDSYSQRMNTGTHSIELKVTDEYGATDTDSVSLDVVNDDNDKRRDGDVNARINIEKKDDNNDGDTDRLVIDGSPSISASTDEINLWEWTGAVTKSGQNVDSVTLDDVSPGETYNFHLLVSDEESGSDYDEDTTTEEVTIDTEPEQDPKECNITSGPDITLDWTEDKTKTASFTADASAGPDCTIDSYTWYDITDNNKKQVGTGDDTTVVFDKYGENQIQVAVETTDPSGPTDSVTETDEQVVEFKPKPDASLEVEQDGEITKVNCGDTEEVNTGTQAWFRSTSTDLDGTIEEHNWDISGTQTTGDTVVRTFNNAKNLHKGELSVTDNDGQTDTCSFTIKPVNDNEPPKIVENGGALGADTYNQVYSGNRLSITQLTTSNFNYGQLGGKTVIGSKVYTSNENGYLISTTVMDPNPGDDVQVIFEAGERKQIVNIDSSEDLHSPDGQHVVTGVQLIGDGGYENVDFSVSARDQHGANSQNNPQTRQNVKVGDSSLNSRTKIEEVKKWEDGESTKVDVKYRFEGDNLDKVLDALPFTNGGGEYSTHVSFGNNSGVIKDGTGQFNVETTYEDPGTYDITVKAVAHSGGQVDENLGNSSPSEIYNDYEVVGIDSTTVTIEGCKDVDNDGICDSKDDCIDANDNSVCDSLEYTEYKWEKKITSTETEWRDTNISDEGEIVDERSTTVTEYKYRRQTQEEKYEWVDKERYAEIGWDYIKKRVDEKETKYKYEEVTQEEEIAWVDSHSTANAGWEYLDKRVDEKVTEYKYEEVTQEEKYEWVDKQRYAEIGWDYIEKRVQSVDKDYRYKWKTQDAVWEETCDSYSTDKECTDWNYDWEKDGCNEYDWEYQGCDEWDYTRTCVEDEYDWVCTEYKDWNGDGNETCADTEYQKVGCAEYDREKDGCDVEDWDRVCDDWDYTKTKDGCDDWDYNKTCDSTSWEEVQEAEYETEWRDSKGGQGRIIDTREEKNYEYKFRTQERRTDTTWSTTPPQDNARLGHRYGTFTGETDTNKDYEYKYRIQDRETETTWSTTPPQDNARLGHRYGTFTGETETNKDYEYKYRTQEERYTTGWYTTHPQVNRGRMDGALGNYTGQTREVEQGKEYKYEYEVVEGEETWSLEKPRPRQMYGDSYEKHTRICGNGNGHFEEQACPDWVLDE